MTITGQQKQNEDSEARPMVVEGLVIDMQHQPDDNFGVETLWMGGDRHTIEPATKEDFDKEIFDREPPFPWSMEILLLLLAILVGLLLRYLSRKGEDK